MNIDLTVNVCKYDPSPGVPYLETEMYPLFLDEETANALYKEIISIPELRDLIDRRPNRRSNITVGDAGKEYTITFGGYGGRPENTIIRRAIPWEEISCGQSLLAIKRMVEWTTNVPEGTYTICVVQYYPHGRVGIHPHRDKEMLPGTTSRPLGRRAGICGISLGATRTLEMSPPHFLPDEPPLRLELGNGSMYVLLPPTNDWWKHSIVKDQDIDIPRISLTFRSY